jgi:acyl-coenzyme A synthetase/AMP-(fatty) acid ligase
MVRTIGHLFFHAAERHSARTALRPAGAPDRAWTFAALADAVRETALGLTSLGIGVGDRVALIADNSASWLIADLSILSIGAIDVPRGDGHDAERDRLLGAPLGVARRRRPGSRDARRTRAHARGHRRLANDRAARRLVSARRSAHRALARRSSRARSEAARQRRDARVVHGATARQRPRDDRLHVGHDGQAQGRHADARQHPAQHPRDPRGRGVHARRRVLVDPAGRGTCSSA